MRMGSVNGLGDFRALDGSGRIPDTSLMSSYTPGGLRTLTSSALIQPSQAQNLNNSINTLGMFQPIVSPESQHASLFQGIPSSLELDQLQPSKCASLFGDFNSISDPRILTAPTSAFVDTKFSVGSSNNCLTTVPNNPLILQGYLHQAQTGGGFRNRSSIEVAYLDSFNNGSSDSSLFLDHGRRRNDNWQSTSKFSSNPLPLSETFNHDLLPPNIMRDDRSSTGPHILDSSLEFSSSTTVSATLEESRGEMQSQQGLISDMVRNMNQAQIQRWGERKQDYTHDSNNIFRNFQVPTNGVLPALGQSMDQTKGVRSRKMDGSLVGRSNVGASTLMPHNEIENSSMDSRMRSSEDCILEQTKSQGGFLPNSYDSLDDLMSAII